MSVPLHLVTGFLGSGKTTFLEYYLEFFLMKKELQWSKMSFPLLILTARY